jgi:hypothetical protein
VYFNGLDGILHWTVVTITLGESIYSAHLGKDDLQVKRCSHPDLMNLMSKDDNRIQSTKAYHTLNASKT